MINFYLLVLQISLNIFLTSFCDRSCPNFLITWARSSESM